MRTSTTSCAGCQVRRTPTSTMSDDIPTRTSEAWREYRGLCHTVAAAYRATPEPRLHTWAENISTCALSVAYAFEHSDTGQWRRKLASARLCRVRSCPVCQWRRSLRISQQIDNVIRKRYDGDCDVIPLMLTLTMKNCAVDELKTSIKKMLDGWSRLRKREIFVQGVDMWVRSIEVTPGQAGPSAMHAHPHIHVLLMAHKAYVSALLDGT